ncbi:MAG: heavy metal translocating P-type ATPase [Butyrivibrio sp.]
MERYKVTGMSCASCSARVEKAVSGVDGVRSCSVNLLTNSMEVEGDADPGEVIAAVKKAGYGAGLQDNSVKNKSNEKGDIPDRDTPLIVKRLVFSLIFLAALMYFSMGHMMFGWPLPAFLEGNHVAMGLIQLLFSGIIMVINQKFFINGFKGLIHGAPNMDTLVAIGAGASFVYSTYALFAMTDAQMRGNMDAVMEYMDEFYFESAAMILTLITVGKMLEAHSKGKTTNAIKGLMELAPKSAVVLVDGAEQTVPVEQVKKGDIFIVRAGESIPVDGVITEGNTAIDESALTGESIPVDKSVGDTVSAATISRFGYIRCEATRVGEDTTLARIIQMVNDASASKAPIAKIADRVSGVFVPIVMGIAFITVIVWLITGQSFGFALGRGISVLVISCPCALGLATPVAIMVGNGLSARNGILFKTAEAIENTGHIRIIALDKTGTITKGEPEVTGIYPLEGCTEGELMECAYALESKSEHPLAAAIVKKAREMGIQLRDSEDYTTLPGNGLTGRLNGSLIFVGNLNFTGEMIGEDITGKITEEYDRLAAEGITPILVGRDKKLLGIIGVSDVMKEDSIKAISVLKKMGIRTVMLTGDNERTANAIGKLAGVDEVIAGVLPKGKEEVVQKLKKQGKTAMVGDGINDAPALTAADIGIAIGNGTDIAIDAADVVLMKNSLMDVAGAIRISRRTLLNIKENLFWAFIYNVIGIPLAAGVWYNALGWELNPMYGAAAMSLSSFCVVMNALRLNLIKVYPKDTVINNGKEENTMTKTMKIEGMMCGHCEASVKKALESVPGVESAEADHNSKTARVVLAGEVADEVLIKAVEELDYKVISVE